MAYVPHVLIQFGGAFSASDMLNEQWSCTLRGYVPAGGGYLTNPQGYCDSIFTPLKNWFVAATSGICPAAQLTYVKTNNITPAGTYKDSITAMRSYIPVAVGGGSTQQVGFLCNAYTWETGLSIGKARRGRMFPPNGYAMATPQIVSISTANTALAATAAKALLAVFNVVDPGTSNKLRPAIISRSGAFNDITGVSVDTIFDVQRRRKKQAVGVRSAVVAFP